jgi:hypothetical protein
MKGNMETWIIPTTITVIAAFVTWRFWEEDQKGSQGYGSGLMTIIAFIGALVAIFMAWFVWAAVTIFA